MRQLTDDAQVVTDEYSFDGWGKLTSSTGSTANSQLYKGEYLAYRKDPDAGPELQYSTHHRNYNPQTGVFTAADPAKDDLNLYRYVKNNPVNQVDPSGLDYLTTEGNIAKWVVEDEYIGSWDGPEVTRIELGIVDAGMIYLRPTFGAGTVDLNELTSFVAAGMKNKALQFSIASLNEVAASERTSYITFAIAEVEYRRQVGTLTPGSMPAASNTAISVSQNAKEFGPLVNELAWSIATELAIEFGGGAAITAVAKGGKLILRSGSQVVEFTTEQIAKKFGKNAKDVPLDNLARKLDGSPIGAIADKAEDLANKAIRGSVSRDVRDGYLQLAKKQFPLPNDLRFLYGQAKNQFDPSSKVIRLICKEDDVVGRGVFYEELQHAIDHYGGKNWVHIPPEKTVANAKFHLEVFERMAKNPIFDVTDDEFKLLSDRIHAQIEVLEYYNRVGITP